MATPSGTTLDSSTDLEDRPWEDFLISDFDLIPYAQPYSSFGDWEFVRGLAGFGHYHVYHHVDGRRRTFTGLKELLLYVSFGDLCMLRHRMHSHYSSHPGILAGRDVYYDLNQLCLHFDAERMRIFWQDQDSWRVFSWTLFERC